VVALLAPGAPARVLAGEVEVVASDAPGLAALWSGTGPLSDPVASCDAAVVFSRSADLIAALGTLPRVIEWDPQPPPGRAHAASWYAGALEALGVPAIAQAPMLSPTPEEREAADEVARALPQGFLALHPGSGSPSKNWPADRFAALAEALAPRQRVLIVEGPADRDAASRVRALLPGAVIARDLPLRVLGALLSGAGLYVGNDSGVGHLAAAYGARCLVLFGPTDPDVWKPLGPRVRVLRAPGGHLDALDVSAVSTSQARARPGG